ncbi:uncharacterized protein EV422DRAFT_509366 [Fimicolochytrium jonesii]|uniref:uncharacterized protein n=1 Tax=Fimicolochytrium jonesii TaxID=1396493 RepID=UPI0022FDB829|nr:uncharacterized protein EV422DRAFT_509366 [Fimicolochytrium jonesii]KAI8816935.1 hypothetical protein EV422DRAFT_509366 [Fimicolochytrium jonesii]
MAVCRGLCEFGARLPISSCFFRRKLPQRAFSGSEKTYSLVTLLKDTDERARNNPTWYLAATLVYSWDRAQPVSQKHACPEALEWATYKKSLVKDSRRSCLDANKPTCGIWYQAVMEPDQQLAGEMEEDKLTASKMEEGAQWINNSSVKQCNECIIKIWPRHNGLQFHHARLIVREKLLVMFTQNNASGSVSYVSADLGIVEFTSLLN